MVSSDLHNGGALPLHFGAARLPLHLPPGFDFPSTTRSIEAAQAISRLGQEQAQRQEWDSAIQIWSHAAHTLPELSPSTARLHGAMMMQIGECFYQQKDIARAVEAFEIACCHFAAGQVEGSPEASSCAHSSAIALFRLAQLHEHACEPSKSYDAARKAEKILFEDTPDQGLPASALSCLLASRMHCARLAIQLGKPEEARPFLYRAWEDASTTLPDTPIMMRGAAACDTAATMHPAFVHSATTCCSTLETSLGNDKELTLLALSIAGISLLSSGKAEQAAEYFARASAMYTRHNRWTVSRKSLATLSADALYQVAARIPEEKLPEKDDRRQLAIAAARREMEKLLKSQRGKDASAPLNQLQTAERWLAFEIRAGLLDRQVSIQSRIVNFTLRLARSTRGQMADLNTYCHGVSELAHICRRVGNQQRVVNILLPLITERDPVFRALPSEPVERQKFSLPAERQNGWIPCASGSPRLAPEIRVQLLKEFADTISYRMRTNNEKTFTDDKFASAMAAWDVRTPQDLYNLGLAARREEIYINTKAFGVKDSRVIASHLDYAEALIADERFNHAVTELDVARGLEVESTDAQLYRGWNALLTSRLTRITGQPDKAAPHISEALKALKPYALSHPLILAAAHDEAAAVIVARAKPEESTDDTLDYLKVALTAADKHLTAGLQALKKAGYVRSPECVYLLRRQMSVLMDLYELPDETNHDWLDYQRRVLKEILPQLQRTEKDLQQFGCAVQESERDNEPHGAHDETAPASGSTTSTAYTTP